MSFLRDSMKFNLRERVNLYAGLAIGFLTPIVITRYTTVESMIKSKEKFAEPAAWLASLLINITDFPLLFGSTAVGGAGGFASARRLQEQRTEEPKEPTNPYANLTDGHNIYANLTD